MKAKFVIIMLFLVFISTGSWTRSGVFSCRETMTGRVTDIEGNPVSGITVHLNSMQCTTGKDGYFSFLDMEYDYYYTLWIPASINNDSFRKEMKMQYIPYGSLSCSGLNTDIELSEWSETLGRIDKIVFADENNGWALRNTGYFYKTTNGGDDWASSSTIFVEMDFVDSNNGWVLGYNGQLYRTTNGGDDWTVKDAYLKQIDFIDVNNGWGASGAGKVLKTVDGGESWTVLAEGIADGYCYEMMFVDSNNGWLLGEEKEYGNHNIFHTVDGGYNWVKQSGEFSVVQFIDANNGWAIRNSNLQGSDYSITSRLYYTNNGGKRWHGQTGLTQEVLNDVHFVDKNNGWIVGDNGTIMHTRDSGNNWAYVCSGADKENIYKVYFITNEKGWIVKQTDYSNNSLFKRNLN